MKHVKRSFISEFSMCMTVSLMNLLKNNPTPNKSNHKKVQFGSYSNSVFFCLIGKMVQNEVRLSHYLSPMESFTKEIFIYLYFHGKHNHIEIVKVLLGSYEEEYLCKFQPIDVSNNVTF